MASIYDLKPAFQNLLRPLATALARAGVTPNQITVAALILSAGAGAAIALWPTARWPLLLLPAVLFVRLALNAVDGMIAREQNRASPLGAMLNELGDVASDAMLYLPLAFVPGFPAAAVVLAVVVGTMTEFAGLLAQTLGRGRRYDGPLGKSDRAFALGGLSLLVAIGVPPGWWLDGVLWLVVALGLWTVVQRCRRALDAPGAS